jgi:uncharacterized membrane protein YcaP (DUF421 family)
MPWWFDSWQGPLRVAAVGTAAYVALLCVLRLSGKRTLAKFNAFDFVVTVALGSTLATVLVDRSVPLAEGVAALALLVALQFAVAWLSVRSGVVRRAVRSEPTLLLHRGRFLDDALRRERVTRDTVESALRSAGIVDLAAVQAVVLETSGDLAVVRGGDTPVRCSTLSGLGEPEC